MVEHTFRVCFKVTQIWFTSNLGIEFKDKSIETFAQWLEDHILLEEQGITDKSASIIYSSWIAQYNQCFEKNDIYLSLSLQGRLPFSFD